jgi:hypothetical protein
MEGRALLGLDYKTLRRIPYLILLVKYGINEKEFSPISLTRMANDIGTTPQNVFKIIGRLVDDGFIQKSTVNGQLMIKVHTKGFGSAPLRYRYNKVLPR